MSEDQKRPQAELLYGMDAISRHLGITLRQAYHLHEAVNIPTFKVGRKVCAKRTDLDRWLDRQAQRAIEGEHAGE